MIYFILLLFTMVSVAVGVYYYRIFKHNRRGYSKDDFKNIELKKDILKHCELGIFVSLVSKISKSYANKESVENELIDIMLDNISALFPEPKKAKEIFLDIFNEQSRIEDNTLIVAQALGKAIKKNKIKQQKFLEFLTQIVFLDYETTYEYEVLVNIAEAFFIDAQLYNDIFNQFEKANAIFKHEMDVEQAYKILSVGKSDDINSVKAAYRELLNENSINVVQASDKYEFYDEVYGEYHIVISFMKLREIHQAYEKIKSAKKLLNYSNIVHN